MSVFGPGFRKSSFHKSRRSFVGDLNPPVLVAAGSRSYDDTMDMSSVSTKICPNPASILTFTYP